VQAAIKRAATKMKAENAETDREVLA
jgi:hypothetical protein